MALAFSVPPNTDENAPLAALSETTSTGPKSRPATKGAAVATARRAGNHADNSPATTRTNPAAMRAQRQYQQAQIEAASPAQLVVMLYDGAIRFCARALEAMEIRAIEEQHNNLLRVQRIVSELMGSLNREAGGEMAENLFRLYLHMMEQLVHANLQDDRAAVENVRVLLSDLRDSWAEADRLQTQQGTASLP